jgi:hypothetical protein
MNVIDTHSKIINIDLNQFLIDYQYFLDNYYQNIVDYYSAGADLKKEAIENLDSIYSTSKLIINSYSINRDRLSGDYDSWEILLLLQDISENLDTIKNSKTWYKSDKDLVYNTNNKYDYVLKQGQTLEVLADELGYGEPQDDWTDIALENDLIEEDYSPAGGVVLKVSFKNNLEFKIKTVQKAPRGEEVYGRDFDKYIHYNEAGDDLDILSPGETIRQAYEVLLRLTKGSVPEFPKDGYDKSLISSNIHSLQYPVLFRQLSAIFSKDDTFKSFTFNKVSRDVNAVLIDTSVVTRLNEVLDQQQIAIG